MTRIFLLSTFVLSNQGIGSDLKFKDMKTTHAEKSLIELLDEVGIKRIYETKERKYDVPHRYIRYLEFNGKQIECPPHDRCYEVVKNQFGIDLTTFND